MLAKLPLQSKASLSRIRIYHPWGAPTPLAYLREISPAAVSVGPLSAGAAPVGPADGPPAKVVQSQVNCSCVKGAAAVLGGSPATALGSGELILGIRGCT